jgi:hypothetical protein
MEISAFNESQVSAIRFACFRTCASRQLDAAWRARLVGQYNIHRQALARARDYARSARHAFTDLGKGV